MRVFEKPMTKKRKKMIEGIILVIEDEKMLAEMYRDKLERSGFKVHSAFDAEEGLEMALKVKPNLILLDILLPRENGISFLEKMRGKNEISSIPVIAFSNFDDSQTKMNAQRLKVKDYLIKTDYTPKEIVEKIKKYLK